MSEIATSSRQLDVAKVRHQMDTQSFGIEKRLVYMPIVASTNILAMQLAQEGSEEGTVVLTDSQTAGKGRQGRRWVDMTGCHVLSSTVLRPLFSPNLLVMIASVAVVDAIRDTCGIAATIKWPNDVLIEGHKVAGILIETSHDHTGRFVAIMGIGVNVNGSMEPLASMESASIQQMGGSTTSAITLEIATGHVVSREIFISHLIRHIERHYLMLQREVQSLPTDLESPSRLLRERWRSHLSTLGRTIRVRQGDRTLSGLAEDVNESGELLLRDHSGMYVSITWGDVWH